MSITYKVWDFPDIPISEQLFHSPGAATEGGFTSGGARMLSPEPGGFSVLELRPSLQVNEWDTPFASWIMSKINGEILRVRLARTPQVLTSRSLKVLKDHLQTTRMYDIQGRNEPSITINDLTARFASPTLEGANQFLIDMSRLGNILRIGQVFGYGDYCHMVDDINYDGSGIAVVTSKTPARRNVSQNEIVNFRPYFLGTIANGSEIRSTYRAVEAGAIQLQTIVFNEVII